MKKRNESTPAYVALVSVQVFFGTLAVIGKVVLTIIPPVALVGFRVGITAFVLTLIQTVRGRVWLKIKGDYWRLALLSFVAVTFNQLLFVTGLSLTKASNTSLLAVTIPIFTVAIGSALGFEKLKKLRIVGIILAAAGVIFLIDPRHASFSS
ncbi:MAG: DMT family transporter, partial [Pyrinomonadaceae bacterium]